MGYLINNAGSEVSSEGGVRDRGFAEPDRGQYDVPEPVTALCGGAMMIRKSALQGKPVFASRFFAYFEDTELSLRLRHQGYELHYCPTAQVYHKHASSSREGSAFFLYHVTRNRILFLASYFPEPLWGREYRQAKAHLRHQYRLWQVEPARFPREERLFLEQVPKLLDEWKRWLPEVQAGTFLVRKNRFPRIAVYNNFWDTLGGGEQHAGMIAQTLQRLGPVDLLSESDFDLAALTRHFDLDLRFCRRRLVTPESLHHGNLTAEYDIFVNATYASDLASAARLSYYVVSFPYPLDDRPPQAAAFIDTYDRFLANSAYTSQWLERWWGVKGDILYPSVPLPREAPDPAGKEPLILHVGRFFQEGHNKKQLELVKTFKHLYDQCPAARNWRLVLVGRVHADQAAYFEQVRREATGYPVVFYTDLCFQDLQDLYRRSAIYWHATGLGESLDRNPELYEHFGISTVEAMAWGCVPIVISAGGQPEIVEHGKNGFLFSTETELLRWSRQVITDFKQTPSRYERLSQAAMSRARDFSRAALQKRLLSWLAADGYPLPGDAVTVVEAP
ncbi:MAG TPA: glycosyltransferase [Methylothermaceae bacterium]|nr:glycosyltransferase [Methylothermaceae bacterium]